MKNPRKRARKNARKCVRKNGKEGTGIMNEKTIKEIAARYPESILRPYDTIANLSGLDAICAFARIYNGSSAYVPQLRTIFAECIERDMMQHYNGKNVRALALKYGYSESGVRNIIKRYTNAG